VTEKSGNSNPISLTGPSLVQGGTAGHLPGGYVLRDFRIEQVLGEGGFSVVYLATDLRLEREVAIKEYMPTALATRNPDLSVQVRSSAQHREAFDAGLRSFVNEAKMLAHFEHRALVKVHQFWQERGTAYMVMPRYSGPTLKSWIKQRPTTADPAWVERFLLMLMDAVETLHRENCLHRDVAPDNILVLNDSSPLLLDFGAARRVIGDLTQALTVILKPGFAPIEQYAESASMRQGAWTDVYALSAVAHFMITGKAPTPAVSRVLADDLVPLSVVASDRYPAAFLVALDAGLTVRPQQRPQNIAALRALMNGAPLESTLTTPEPPPPQAQAPGKPVRLPTLAPIDDDDDKTLLVTGRDPIFETGTNTISTASKPASFPIDPVEATGGATDSQPIEPRFPSRSMQVHAQAGAQEHDRWAWLPFLIGAVAIAAVVTAAWFLVDFFNAQAELNRAPPPSSSAPATPPAQVAVATPPSSPPAPTPTAEPPAPAVSSSSTASPAAESTPPVEAPTVQTTASDTATNVAAAQSPSASSPSPPSPSSPLPESAPPSSASPSSPSSASPSSPSPSSPPADAAPLTQVAAATQPASAEHAENASAKAAERTETSDTTKPAEAPVQEPVAVPAEPVAAKPPPAAPAPRLPVIATRAVTPSKPAETKAAPVVPKELATKPAMSTTAETPRASTTAPSLAQTTTPSPPPAAPPPLVLAEMPVAPSITAPTVKTVDAAPPPVQVAAVEGPRAPPRPTAPAVLAPLKPLTQPQPAFPREATRNAIDKGRVVARLFVGADGAVTRVEIVSANPTRVFDREVRETAMRWRYEAPGQPRQTDVEFRFDRQEGQ